jgi:hypothetical protein
VYLLTCHQVYFAIGAGASAVIIYNDATAPDRFGVFAGTLGKPQPRSVPVIAVSHHLGMDGSLSLSLIFSPH